jgi:hypothetical protein
VQDQSFPLFNASARAAATERHLNLNTFCVQFDPGREPVIDLRDELKSLAEELNSEQNADDDRTGCDYFPDMLLPAGLALGYSWQPPGHARLREVNGRAPEKRVFAFMLRDIVAVADEDPLVGVAEDSSVKSVYVALELTGRHHAMGEMEEVHGWCSAGNAPPFDRVLVVGGIDLNQRDDRFHGCGVGDSGAEPWRRGAIRGVVTSGEDIKVTVATHERGEVWVSPQAAVIGVGRALAAVLRAYPKATVIVGGRVPKAIPMAVGWYLAQAKGRPDYPWRRLVPLAYVKNAEGRFVSLPMWVRHDQTDPVEALKQAGIVYDPTSGSWRRVPLPPGSQASGAAEATPCP